MLIVVHIYHSPRYRETEVMTSRAHILITWKSGCYSVLIIWPKQATNCCFDPDSFKFDQIKFLLFFPFFEINETRLFFMNLLQFHPMCTWSCSNLPVEAGSSLELWKPSVISIASIEPVKFDYESLMQDTERAQENRPLSYRKNRFIFKDFTQIIHHFRFIDENTP